MKSCPTCNKSYDDDANFCPEETCATQDGPQRLVEVDAVAPPDRYQLIERLGGQRTGQVWRARDTQSGSEVAYKVIAPAALPSPAAVARVERELRQLMRVQSPRIAAVLDTGKTASGDLYVVMELCEGETLDQVLARGPVDLDRAKHFIAQIGAGLLEAQKAGIVHRDLAPKNILVSASGDCKIINFPIAVPINDKLSGVAEYASPEQGQGRPVDQRSNTYSLACILYHLVTGEPPFVGPDPVTVFGLHGSSPALAPSQRRPEAGLTSDADTTILKALDKNSSRRHLTLRLFLSEIEALKVAPGPTASSKDVGFAKTMLFAGGSQDVQAMVQKALAEKQAKAAAAASAESAAPAPASTSADSTGSATANAPARTSATAPTTAAAAPVSSGAVGQGDGDGGAARLTPPPATPEPVRPAPEVDPVEAARKKAAAAAAAPVAQASGSKGAAFRETLWFKKGDVEQMVAEAKAKAKAAGENEPVVPEEDFRPIEDRYRDDGSLTVEDRKKFSLRTGGTAAHLPTVKASLGDGTMSAADVMAELGGGRRIGVYVLVVAAVVLVVGALLLFMGRGGEQVKKPGTPTAVANPPVEPIATAPAASVPVSPSPASEQPARIPGEESAEPVAAKPPPKKKAAMARKPAAPKPPAKKSVAKK